jgi:CheY-like chemotaxis protein
MSLAVSGIVENLLSNAIKYGDNKPIEVTLTSADGLAHLIVRDILDFMMPLLDGAGVIKAMRADKRLRDVPVLLASALPEKTISGRCNGYNVFLRKPHKTERLMEEISRLLDKSAPRSTKS